MADQSLIKKLKDPEQAQPFGIYEKYFPEKAAILKKANKENCLLLIDNNWKNLNSGSFCKHMTYTLKPDYQPEPEYVDLEIELDDGFYGACSDKGILLPFAFTHLHCLPSLPGFFCFWQEEKNEGYKDTEHISPYVVATRIDGGMKVYARFRKGES